jgi:hypothetical protein
MVTSVGRRVLPVSRIPRRPDHHSSLPGSAAESGVRSADYLREISRSGPVHDENRPTDHITNKASHCTLGHSVAPHRVDGVVASLLRQHLHRAAPIASPPCRGVGALSIPGESDGPGTGEPARTPHRGPTRLAAGRSRSRTAVAGPRRDHPFVGVADPRRVRNWRLLTMASTRVPKRSPPAANRCRIRPSSASSDGSRLRPRA